MNLKLLYRRRAPLAPCLAAAMFAGCGGNADRPPMGRVDGKVTLGGEPLTSGTVTFTPVGGAKGNESGLVATGMIEPDGTYTLTTFDTGDGAVLGQHVVTVVSRDVADMKAMNAPGGNASSPMMVQPRYVLPKASTPSKYADPSTTPLRYTVEEGDNEINLELEG